MPSEIRLIYIIWRNVISYILYVISYILYVSGRLVVYLVVVY
jgi:hypothetical protein